MVEIRKREDQPKEVTITLTRGETLQLLAAAKTAEAIHRLIGIGRGEDVHCLNDLVHARDKLHDQLKDWLDEARGWTEENTFFLSTSDGTDGCSDCGQLIPAMEPLILTGPGNKIKHCQGCFEEKDE